VLQEGRPPPLACTEAEVGFFIWIYAYTHVCERAYTHAETRRRTAEQEDGGTGGDGIEVEEEEEEEEED